MMFHCFLSFGIFFGLHRSMIIFDSEKLKMSSRQQEQRLELKGLRAGNDIARPTEPSVRCIQSLFILPSFGVLVGLQILSKSVSEKIYVVFVIIVINPCLYSSFRKVFMPLLTLLSREMPAALWFSVSNSCLNKMVPILNTLWKDRKKEGVSKQAALPVSGGHLQSGARMC